MVETSSLLNCRPYGVRRFESCTARHVAVAQLVERQIVALHVEDSSSSGHPIRLGSLPAVQAPV